PEPAAERHSRKQDPVKADVPRDRGGRDPLGERQKKEEPKSAKPPESPKNAAGTNEEPRPEAPRPIADRDWKEVVSQEGRSSVLMPSPPRRAKFDLAGLPDSGQDYVATRPAERLTFQAGSVALRGPSHSVPFEQLYVLVLGKLVPGQKINLIREQDVA